LPPGSGSCPIGTGQGDFFCKNPGQAQDLLRSNDYSNLGTKL
jgi:hypothetical protein